MGYYFEKAVAWYRQNGDKKPNCLITDERWSAMVKIIRREISNGFETTVNRLIDSSDLSPFNYTSEYDVFLVVNRIKSGSDWPESYK